ncbi:MAG TPA: glycosyltransferase family 4 protein [Candidatus Thermoplasmatota archaeon]|nr:glycosyltransferase family 4 protein [Candidatus Thermoplasmatota archaeon]
MKVVLAAVRYPPAPGGAETHVAALAEGLVSRGHDVVVHTSDLFTEYPFSRRELPSLVNGVRVVRHRARRLAGAWTIMPDMPRALREERAEVFHAHSYGYYHTIATARAAARAARPFVLTPHFHPPWSMEGGAGRRALRAAFDPTLGQYVVSRAARVIGVSSGEIGVMQRHARLDAAKVSIIPNGFHADRFRPTPDGRAFRDRYQLGDAPVVLFAGRLASNKGLPQLAEAWARVAPKHAGARLVLAGEDQGWRAKLAAASREPLVFTGHLPDDLYRSALAAADLLVLPSEWEAFGIVLAEAAACGTPVVATRVGGAPDVVHDGVTGKLVEYGDVDALAEAMGALLSDPAMRARMGAAGQARAFAEYSWDAVVERTIALYDELL